MTIFFVNITYIFLIELSEQHVTVVCVLYLICFHQLCSVTLRC